MGSAVYFLDLLMNFQMGFIARWDMRAVIVRGAYFGSGIGDGRCGVRRAHRLAVRIVLLLGWRSTLPTTLLFVQTACPAPPTCRRPGQRLLLHAPRNVFPRLGCVHPQHHPAFGACQWQQRPCAADDLRAQAAAPLQVGPSAALLSLGCVTKCSVNLAAAEISTNALTGCRVVRLLKNMTPGNAGPLKV